MKTEFQNPKKTITLLMDSSEIFPNDPGQGTPALVIRKDGTRWKQTATYNVATLEGYLDGCRDGDYELNDEELNWLNSMEETVDNFLTKYGG